MYTVFLLYILDLDAETITAGNWSSPTSPTREGVMFKNNYSSFGSNNQEKKVRGQITISCCYIS